MFLDRFGGCKRLHRVDHKPAVASKLLIHNWWPLAGSAVSDRRQIWLLNHLQYRSFWLTCLVQCKFRLVYHRNTRPERDWRSKLCFVHWYWSEDRESKSMCRELFPHNKSDQSMHRFWYWRQSIWQANHLSWWVYRIQLWVDSRHCKSAKRDARWWDILWHKNTAI